MYYACPPPKIDRNTKDGDWNITGARSFNPPTIACWIVIAISLLAFVLWPNKPIPQNRRPEITLTNSEAASLRTLFEKIQGLDAKIGLLDKKLFEMDVRGNLSDPKIVEIYYLKLSELQSRKIDRANSVENYNRLARSHFTRTKTSPVEMRLRKDFLPTGIR